jgi:hypothetical protein
MLNGENEFIYHENGKECIIYSKEDMLHIINEAHKHRVYHTTYFNVIKQCILSIDDMYAIQKIYYGMPIPEQYQTEALKALL